MKKYLFVYFFLGLLISFIMNGCTILPDVERPVQLYTLTPLASFSGGPIQKNNSQIIIERPISSSALETVRLIIKHNTHQLDYLGDVQWVDNTPAMVQNLLIETLSNSNIFKAVGNETSGLKADFLLKTDLQEFNIFENNQKISLNIRMNIKLLSMPDRQIIDTMSIENKIDLSDRQINNVIAGFDTIFHKTMQEIVLFISEKTNKL
ncbi:MAG: ABC-type transport auxiliary lipoprotein family protein [Alphaproteobacteria bacterium]|nr:ABC-type transport auxiliary lipoprotein family protein [Alphaproteobacteria bacterium]